MSTPPVTFESVWTGCTTNQRVVPIPSRWNELYRLLKGTRQNPTGGWTPPLPLILAAWSEATDQEKQSRLRTHLEWAERQGQLEAVHAFLSSLPETEWCHQGEL